MTGLALGLASLVASGLLAAAAGRRRPGLAMAAGLGGAVAGCLLSLVPSLGRLLGGPDVFLRIPWNVPAGSLSLGLDALSAWFAALVCVIGGVSAVYGARYLAPHAARRNVGALWLFYNLLIAGMLAVVTARNGVLFLAAWEVMSLAAYFLVVWEDERAESRRAGWIYLAATQIGTAFLLGLFVCLGAGSGSLDFEGFRVSGRGVDAAFALALIGFGAKAGFAPMHVWLPEAHPAAPSHVSAVMSGVMIKTGIYGILRMIVLLGPPPEWVGWTLLGLGVVSGVGGVLMALAQHDLKRLLAYHSVENIGIIAMGMGLGLLGMIWGLTGLTLLGFGAALLHTWNHAIFKSLLFLAAGAVHHATHTLEMDRLGGLMKRMPRTATLFLVGSAAICGLPPLNGFISEFLLFSGGYEALRLGAVGGIGAGTLAIGALALIAGLAVACFAKAMGIVFLGESRTQAAGKAREAPGAMVWPMAALALACALLGLGGAWAAQLVMPVAASVGAVNAGSETMGTGLAQALESVALVFAVFIAMASVVSALRAWLLRGRPVATAGTWDCGYAAPSARMQYTASSFAQPIVDLFSWVIGSRKEASELRNLFPTRAQFHSHADDPMMRRLYEPVFRAASQLASWLRPLQQGHLQVYVLYVAVTLIVLLIWKLG